jgi:cysteine synthase A
MLKAYGAQLELALGAEGMKGAIRRAEDIVNALPTAFMLQQFRNPANPKVHRETTAEELWADIGSSKAVVLHAPNKEYPSAV